MVQKMLCVRGLCGLDFYNIQVPGDGEGSPDIAWDSPCMHEDVAEVPPGLGAELGVVHEWVLQVLGVVDLQHKSVQH